MGQQIFIISCKLRAESSSLQFQKRPRREFSANPILRNLKSSKNIIQKKTRISLSLETTDKFVFRS